MKAGHVWQQINLTYYGADATRMRVEGYLQDDTSILCSLVEHRLTGFYRSERPVVAPFGFWFGFELIRSL